MKNCLFDVKFKDEVNIDLTSVAPKTITANGTYDARVDGVDGYDRIIVNTPHEEQLRSVIDGSITEFDIPYGTTYITNYCFHSRYNLARVTIPSTVTDIGFSAFGQCKKLESIEIPDGITTIRENTFGSCRALAQIKIPDTVTNILTGAFAYCSVLPSISFPDSVTSIGKEAFSGCTGLTSVTIGNGVTSIGGWVFDGCKNCLEYDFSKCTSVPSLGSSAFSGINASAEILVPRNLYDSWKAATNWVSYKNYIVSKTHIQKNTIISSIDEIDPCGWSSRSLTDYPNARLTPYYKKDGVEITDTSSYFSGIFFEIDSSCIDARFTNSGNDIVFYESGLYEFGIVNELGEIAQKFYVEVSE